MKKQPLNLTNEIYQQQESIMNVERVLSICTLGLESVAGPHSEKYYTSNGNRYRRRLNRMKNHLNWMLELQKKFTL